MLGLENGNCPRRSTDVAKIALALPRVAISRLLAMRENTSGGETVLGYSTIVDYKWSHSYERSGLEMEANDRFYCFEALIGVSYVARL